MQPRPFEEWIEKGHQREANRGVKAEGILRGCQGE